MGREKLEMDAKWDACSDLTLRRFFYSSVAGMASAVLFFRSPVTRWAAVAFGAGLGLGSAYTDCSHIMDGCKGILLVIGLAAGALHGNVEGVFGHDEAREDSGINFLVLQIVNKVRLAGLGCMPHDNKEKDGNTETKILGYSA